MSHVARAAGLHRGTLALLAGLLLALAQPKFGHSAVGFVALAPLLVALDGVTPGRGFRLGYLAGVVAGLGLLYWTAVVMVRHGGLPWAVALLGLTASSAVYAIFCGLSGWAMAVWQQRQGRRALFAAPLAWVAGEVLSAYTLFRFPWCLLGYSQWERPALLQVAAFTAVYGVSFVLAAVSAALAGAWLERGARRLWALSVALVLPAALWAFGTWRLSRPLPPGETLRVGLVQASIPQDEKWDPQRAHENLTRHLQLTREAAAQGARLVVWPESALPYSYDEDPLLRRQLEGLVRELGVYLLFGNEDHEPGAEPRYYVAAKMLAPSGAVAFRYHKVRLVPFGEYVPLKALFTLGGRTARLVQRAGEFSPGQDYTVGRADGRPLATLICYEAIFPDLARAFTARGAGLLLNLTNDGWFGTSSAPYQHFAMSVLRAVENGVPLGRAANTGISALVDARGRVLARSELFGVTALVGDLNVPPTGGGTFYARHGDLFAGACLAAAVALTLGPRRRSAAPGA